MKNIKNKKFLVITSITSIVFCLTTISIPTISFVLDKKNNQNETFPDDSDNNPNPEPEPTPPPEPEPNPPNDNKTKTTLKILNNKSLLEKYLINNRIHDVENHFNDLNGTTSLDDIWKKFNNFLFKTFYMHEFVNQVQRVLFSCKNIGNNSYTLLVLIQLKNELIFDDGQNKKQFTITFNYINDIPPELTPPESDFKTFSEAFDRISGHESQEPYNFSFPLLTNANSLGDQSKNKQLITNFIERYDKLSLLRSLMRQEWVYQLMSFVFSNFNEYIYDWGFYTDSYGFQKVTMAFNLKENVTITNWKNNIFGNSINQTEFMKNDKMSITISYSDFDSDGSWKMKAADFVKNKEWYDNDGNRKIISNAPQVLMPFVSLDFKVNDNVHTVNGDILTLTPYTMFWDFLERDSTIFSRPSNADNLDEYSFGLAPVQIKIGNSNDLSLDILPFDLDLQYNRNDIKYANSMISLAFNKFNYNINYEVLAQLRYFVNYNFSGLFSKEDTYKVNEPNKIIYETQIKLEKDRSQGLFFKIFPKLWQKTFDYKINDIVKVRIEKKDNVLFSNLDNPGFYYLGYDWSVISNPLSYDGSWIKNYLDDKRFPPIKVDNKKNVTSSSQISSGDFSINVSVIRNGNTINIVNENFVLRHVCLSMPISYNYYINRKTPI